MELMDSVLAPKSRRTSDRDREALVELICSDTRKSGLWAMALGIGALIGAAICALAVVLPILVLLGLGAEFGRGGTGMSLGLAIGSPFLIAAILQLVAGVLLCRFGLAARQIRVLAPDRLVPLALAAEHQRKWWQIGAPILLLGGGVMVLVLVGQLTQRPLF